MQLDISPLTLQEKISDESVRTSKIIASALGLGVSMFFLVCYLIYRLNYREEIPSAELPPQIKMLTYALVLVCIMIYLMVLIVPNNSVRESIEAIKNKKTDSIDYNELVSIHRTYMIIRFALLEGTSLFGLVLLIISITNNSIYSNSLCWLYALPMVIFIGFIIINFPTKEKIISFIQDKFS